MKLSAPAYSLKRLAKSLSREESIPMHSALDRVAQDEGFASWSLLASQLSVSDPASELLSRLKSGEMMLLGARPGHGKTLMGLDLVNKAVKSGRQGWFFTLEWNMCDVLSRLRNIGEDPSKISDLFNFDNSNAISASYIIDRLGSAPSGTVVVIDYLQLLDQKRDNPNLALQVSALKTFSCDQGIVLVFLSQIDRAYDLTTDPIPSLADVRLPNPLDLTLFDKTCFLHNGAIQVSALK